MSVDISVIIPVYNAEKTLGRCLDSILCQKPCLEVFLINDCSTDGTLKVCKEYQSRYSNVSVISNSSNVGQGLSRNVGIKKAAGTYLAFVDADDMISEYMFDDLFSLARTGDYDIVGCRLKEINEDELLKSNFSSFVNQIANQRLRSVKSFNKEAIESVLVSALIGGVVEEPLEEVLPWSSCTYLYRNDLVKANNIAFLSERVTYSEDLFFNLDAFRRADSCAITTTEYYFYLKNPLSTVHRYHDPVSKCEKLLTYTGNNKNLFQKAQLRIFNTFVGSLLRLVADSSIPWFEKRSIAKKLNFTSVFVDSFLNMSTKTLTFPSKVFLMLARKKWTSFELALVYAAAKKNQILDLFHRGRGSLPVSSKQESASTSAAKHSSSRNSK